MKAEPQSRGFSLIELIVVIAIVTALVAFAISNFPGIQLRFALVRSANAFQENTRKAQQMALSGLVYRDSSGAEQSVDGYGVYVDFSTQGKKKYILYADKTPGNKAYDAQDYVVETLDFSLAERGIHIKEMQNVLGQQASVNFNALKIETTITQLAPGQNNAKFVFSFESDETITKSVWVNTSGLIEIK